VNLFPVHDFLQDKIVRKTYMQRYHINLKGDPGRCSAQKGQCPFGEDAAHYDTAQQARAAFERNQLTLFQVVNTQTEELPVELSVTAAVVADLPLFKKYPMYMQDVKQNFATASEKKLLAEVAKYDMYAYADLAAAGGELASYLKGPDIADKVAAYEKWRSAYDRCLNVVLKANS
jgi:hypothetical protein